MCDSFGQGIAHTSLWGCRLPSAGFRSCRRLRLAGTRLVYPTFPPVPATSKRFNPAREKEAPAGRTLGRDRPATVRRYAAEAMGVSLKTKRNLCGTDEAARIYGCSTTNIRIMAAREQIWSEEISDRVYVYDADEIRRKAEERESLRRSGKLGGRRPGGKKSA